MLIQPLTPEILEKRRVFRRKLLGVPGAIWRKTRRGSSWTRLKLGSGLKWTWRNKGRVAFWTLAVAFLLHSALNIYASTLLNRELAAIRQRGEPLQLREMEPPRVPDAQNAALIYAQAFQSLRFSDAQKGSFRTRQSNRSPQQIRWIEEAARNNQKAIALTRRAALMPRCRFPFDWKTDNPMGLLFPYYGELRELADLLGAQAQIEAKRGNMGAALRDVRAIFGISHHLSREPVLIGFLVAQAIDATAHQTLARVLEAAPVTSNETNAFQNSLPKTDWHRALRHCFLAERTFQIFVFEKIAPHSLNEIIEDYAPIWTYYPLSLGWKPVLKLDEVETLRLWKLHLKASASTPPFASSNQSLDEAIDNTPRYANLTRALFPVFGSVGVNRDRAEVRRRQREIALALAIYRTRNKTYPTQHTALKQSLPLDPYSQKPFVYRLDKDEKGFTLYSVGPNRTDDDGINNSDRFSGNMRYRDDIVWGEAKR